MSAAAARAHALHTMTHSARMALGIVGQTTGKVDRCWRTLNDDLLDETTSAHPLVAILNRVDKVDPATTEASLWTPV